MRDPIVWEIPLSSGRAKNVQFAVLHVVSLARYAILAARGWAANSVNARVRPAADMDDVLANLVLAEVFGGSVEVPCKASDAIDIGLLGGLGGAAEAHLLDHTASQSGHDRRR